MNPSREQVRTVPCPKCGVGSNQKCIRMNGRDRESTHSERVRHFILSL